MFSWLWRCSSPQDWPSRPTAVGANAPSANRANVRPAIAGAEPELAYWGVYPPGYTPPFFVGGKVSSGGECLCQRRGKFSYHPALREQRMRRNILISCWSSRNPLICSTRCTTSCSWGWSSKVHWWGSIRCNVSDMVRLGLGIGREGVGERGELGGGWIS